MGAPQGFPYSYRSSGAWALHCVRPVQKVAPLLNLLCYSWRIMALIVFFSDLSGVRRWPLICVDWLLLPCKFVAAWQRRVVVLAAAARSTLPCSPGEPDQARRMPRSCWHWPSAACEPPVNRALACAPSAPRLCLGNPFCSCCVCSLDQVFCIWQSLFFPYIISYL